MQSIMQLKLKNSLAMYLKGILMYGVCDNLWTCMKMYEKGFFKKLAYVVNINCNTMTIQDS
jgi:hypothetical protein